MDKVKIGDAVRIKTNWETTWMGGIWTIIHFSSNQMKATRTDGVEINFLYMGTVIYGVMNMSITYEKVRPFSPTKQIEKHRMVTLVG
jgi:hypothetical protein